VTVSLAEQTSFVVDIHALDGTRIASRRGTASEALVFTGLRPHSVYLVTVTTPYSRVARRVLID
jgi:hypothetical protein